ncbi:hypothetical protein CA984_15800 [Streptosporangium minutum]|uniref:Uncharacterized protein n=1 Tax=Streptosporangium minutum TaxID=569862 RepID=A0A243RMM0_9ACTN|nr:hypothetical protein CA984_15800 [Streptosporangium minutum]
MTRPAFAVLIPHAGRAAGRAPTGPARSARSGMTPFTLLTPDRPAEAGPVADAFRGAAAGLPRPVV